MADDRKYRGISVGVLHHKHGNDIFVGWNDEQVYAKVYEYVSEWWADFADPGQELPEDHLEAIKAYFELAGDQEWLDMMGDTVEMPPPTE